MKAVLQEVYGETDVLTIGDVEKPAVGADDLIVRVHAVGVDQGVWHIMAGLPYPIRLAGYGLRAPRTRLRADVAGRVEAVGANVTRFQVGDEVFGVCDGAFAEYAVGPADKFVLKPPSLSFEQAAVLPTSACTALQALRDRGELKSGQKVLIIGAAGGVGTFAVQLAKAFGAEVTGVCSTRKVDLVRSLGADDVIDYTSADFADRDGHYDLILDTAGSRPLAVLRRALTPHGTLVIVGGEGGGRWFQDLRRQFVGLLLTPFVGQKLRTLLGTQPPADLAVLLEFVAAGQLTPVVDRAYPLSQVPEAIRYLRAGHARGKVVITV
jgi:NADPH:quinone reductase-like Zn-dependent oxidoreductase